MRPSTLIAAVFAGGALAAPLQANKIQERALVYHTEVEVVTITVTAGYGAPTPVSKHKKHKPKPKHPKPTPPPPAPAPVPAPPAPAPAPPAPAPAPPAPAPAPVYAPAPAPKPAPAPAPVSSGSGNSMLDIANKYRSLLGQNKLSWSDDCANNAQITGQMNGGSELTHEGRPINSGQVISPGAANNFEMVYTGGWLCEVPSGPIASVCATNTAALHIDHQGLTGHWKILTDPGYKSIGCAYTPDASGQKPFYNVWGGQWVCNLDR